MKARLLTLMRLKISTLEPYHEFAGVLFKTAANPQSALNPFAADSDPVRNESIGVFKDLVEDSNVRIPKDLRAELPYLLWLYHMGIILFWIHDSSNKQRRTYRLIDHDSRFAGPADFAGQQSVDAPGAKEGFAPGGGIARSG